MEINGAHRPPTLNSLGGRITSATTAINRGASPNLVLSGLAQPLLPFGTNLSEILLLKPPAGLNSLLSLESIIEGILKLSQSGIRELASSLGLRQEQTLFRFDPETTHEMLKLSLSGAPETLQAGSTNNGLVSALSGMLRLTTAELNDGLSSLKRMLPIESLAGASDTKNIDSNANQRFQPFQNVQIPQPLTRFESPEGTYSSRYRTETRKIPLEERPKPKTTSQKQFGKKESLSDTLKDLGRALLTQLKAFVAKVLFG